MERGWEAALKRGDSVNVNISINYQGTSLRSVSFAILVTSEGQLVFGQVGTGKPNTRPEWLVQYAEKLVIGNQNNLGCAEMNALVHAKEQGIGVGKVEMYTRWGENNKTRRTFHKPCSVCDTILSDLNITVTGG